MKRANKILIHLLFWALSFIIFSLVFNLSGNVSRVDLIFAGLFHITLFFCAYVNLAVLSLLFNKRRYFLFVLANVATIVLAMFLNYLTFRYLADILFPGYYFVSHFESWEVMIVIMIYMLITTLLKLSYAWFELQKARQRLAAIEKENVKSELRMLKAQINPHFLFNSLNAIYSLAIKGSGKTPEAIIHLADILRYVIYESNKEKIAIHDEAKIIREYIELQKFRLDPSSKITFVDELQDEHLEITPLLLLPLVENSFKHGAIGDVGDGFVEIALFATNKDVVFEIRNSKPPDGHDKKNRKEGMGNENIRQRLNLLYPDRHLFSIEDKPDVYSVKLVLHHES